jgi:branched-chain amino acid transport system substrate-binding protein
MTRKLFSVTLVLIFIAAVLAAGCNPSPNTNGNQPPASRVRIAGNLPLTGPVAAWSGQYPDAFRMGIEDACAQLGVPVDTFALDFQDNAGQPSNATSVYQKQQLGGFDLYISGSSEAALAVAPQVDATKVPHFIVAFDPFIVRGHPNRLRIMPNSKIEAPLFVQYAKMRNAKRVYIINLNSAYANSEFGEIVVPALQAAGIESQTERYEFQQRDFKTIVLKAAQYKPDLVFVCGYSIQVYPLLRDLRTGGLLKDGSVMSVMDYVDLLYNNTPKEELQGVVFASPLVEVTNAVASAKDWSARFQAKYNQKPTYVAAYAYDTARAIVKSYKQFGKVDNESIRKALPLDGVTGTINLDGDGDIIATVTLARLSPDGSTVVEVQSAKATAP